MLGTISRRGLSVLVRVVGIDSCKSARRGALEFDDVFACKANLQAGEKVRYVVFPPLATRLPLVHRQHVFAHILATTRSVRALLADDITTAVYEFVSVQYLSLLAPEATIPAHVLCT